MFDTAGYTWQKKGQVNKGITKYTFEIEIHGNELIKGKLAWFQCLWRNFSPVWVLSYWSVFLFDERKEETFTLKLFCKEKYFFQVVPLVGTNIPRLVLN